MCALVRIYHKKMLLLHTIESLYVVDKQQLQMEKQEMHNKYSDSRKGTMGDDKMAFYWSCKNIFNFKTLTWQKYKILNFPSRHF